MINAPFDDCASAQLHRANSIQPYGAMVVIDRCTGQVCAASQNARDYLGVHAQDLIGRPAAMVLPFLSSLSMPEPGEVCLNAGFEFQPIRIGAIDMNVTAHVTQAHWIVEAEAAVEPVSDLIWRDRQLMSAMGQIAVASSIDATALSVMQAVAKATDFDRVLLYQFLPGWHGKVIGEVLRRDVESYMGLHFPAGDIPEVARRLYVAKRQRLIADVSAQPVPVLSQDPGLVVDLSFSELRAVHPTHLDYLRNMGVNASFSVSLVVQGKLWGLVTCHSTVARNVGFLRRQLCEQLAFIGSMRMQDQQLFIEQRERLRHLMVREQIKSELLDLGVGRQSIATQLERLRDLYDASGIWACLKDVGHFDGDVPDDHGLATLHAWIKEHHQESVFGFDQLPVRMQTSPSLRQFASGVLCVGLPDDDFLVLMRAEQVSEVAWAGELPGLEDLKALTPRHSFARWRQETFAQARPWSEVEIEEAGHLKSLVHDLKESFSLKKMALTDSLTGLINRGGFEQALQTAIQASLRIDACCAVMMLDLDYFKSINDEFGHQAGDDVLVEVGKRLLQCMRERDVVSRLGGDEFAIIQFHVMDFEHIKMVCERLIEAFQAPFNVQGHSMTLGISLGVAVCPYDGTNARMLLGRADAALYEVKKSGRNGYRFFSKQAKVH